MDVVYPQSNLVVIAKTCGHKDGGGQKVTYALSEEFHSLCMDRKDVLQAEVEACEKLLKHVVNESDRSIIEEEISALKMALDLLT